MKQATVELVHGTGDGIVAVHELGTGWCKNNTMLTSVPGVGDAVCIAFV